MLALLTLLFAVAFWAGAHVAWLMLVMIGFNPLFLTAGTVEPWHWQIQWQKQFPLDYGKVRLWGSVAFVIGSALTGKLVSMFDYRVILALLTLGVASMLLWLSHPSDDSATRGKPPAGEHRLVCVVGVGSARTGAFWPAFVYCRGHMRPITVLAPFTGRQLATRPRRWGICGRWAWWRKSLSLR